MRAFVLRRLLCLLLATSMVSASKDTSNGSYLLGTGAKLASMCSSAVHVSMNHAC